MNAPTPRLLLAAVDHPLGPLSCLGSYRQFLIVRLVPLVTGKTTKLPVRFNTLEVCDAHDSTAWTDYATASAAAAALGASYCVGFVLTANDPFFCLDIDSCATPAGWSELSRSLVGQLPGCVIEVSQSGGGLHVWGRRSAMPAHSMKDVGRHIELYSSLRFIALGSNAVGEMAEDCTAIDAVAAAFFPPRERAAVNAAQEGPRADWNGPTDDADLLRRAMMSRSSASIFGNKASFADLWDGDETALGRAFPPDSGSTEPYDRSSADAALAQHLAFWSGCDVARIERLMRQSALARDKWDDRSDYLVGRTITNACRMQRDVLQDKPSAVPPPPTEIAAGSNGSGADLLAGLSRWYVTAEKVKDMEETRLIWRNALAGSHLTVWSAPGNGGKTTLALFAAGELSRDGFKVFFFQEDAAAGDMPALYEHASNHGYTLLNSTLASSSPDEQVKHLLALAQSDTDLQGTVMFFDTLKKYLDLMSKGGAREFFRLMRSLTQRGATIVLLGHTNKHLGHDGKPVFEGVGDVRNDVDEMAYLDNSGKDPFGKATLTLRYDKTRSRVTSLSFELDTTTREVKALPKPVDVRALIDAQRQREEDEPVVAAARRVLAGGPMLSTELRKAVAKDSGVGEKAAAKVISRYSSDDASDSSALWIEVRSRINNAREISLLPTS